MSDTLKTLAELDECAKEIENLLKREEILKERLAATGDVEGRVLRRFEDGYYVTLYEGDLVWTRYEDRLAPVTPEELLAINKLEERGSLVRQVTISLS